MDHSKHKQEHHPHIHKHHQGEKQKAMVHDHKSHDHTEHHKMMIRDFQKRFWVSSILTVPVLLLSPMIQAWLGMNLQLPYESYILFALSSLIYFYGGHPFIKGLYSELKKGSPGMMTLIAVAISAAYLYSSAVVFGLEGKTFFWELATLIVVMLLGHWLEMKSVLGASKALEELAKLMPDEAHLITDEGIQKVNSKDLKKGDIILIKPGEKLPADGKITEGSSDINESMITGESKPVNKSSGEEVIGGSINGNGSIKLKVSGTGENAYLSKVINMVREAQDQKSKTQRLADKAAFWLTIAALSLGVITFTVWLLMGKEFSFALERMVTVMVICCPHALGLAIPLVAAISTSLSAKNGLLIRNRTAFENARKITNIVFDKTGTLTKGSHEVSDIQIYEDGYSEKDIIKWAASVESPSEHYISKGLLRKANELNISLAEVKNFNYESGIGVTGKVEGKEVHAGGYLKLEKLNIEIPETDQNNSDTEVFVILENILLGKISMADEIRESSYNAIKALQNADIKVSLLTGDNMQVAAKVAKELGMDDYMAEVLPEDKLKKIKELQGKGEFVAMTGDGINDAPALAQADIGIAIGSGTDVAAETADIILVDSNPEDISGLLMFGRATHKKMIQNLVWATGYNVIAIPMATGFIPGLMISPAAGAALMSLSTIICAINAKMLKFK